MKFLLAGALALFSTMAVAMAEEEASSDAIIAIAEDYLAAYSTFDMSKMAPFLADDMVFRDPTSSGQAADGGAFSYEGRAAVVEQLGAYAGQYKSFTVSYDVERRYESAGVVVFVAQLSYEGETSDGQIFTGSAPIVTAVTVTNGKISAHYDFFDYAGNAVEFGD